MKLGIVTSYPPSKVTLNEYAFHLLKQFRNHNRVTEVVLYTDVSEAETGLNSEIDGCKVSVVKCWKFNNVKNVITIARAIKNSRPDAILYNLQFMKFGDRKIPAALGLFSPWLTKLMKIPTIVLLHNIMEAVDLNSAGFTQSKWKNAVYNRIGTFLTSIVLKADRVAVTINDYVSKLEGKYLAKNVVLIPHGTFEIPDTPTYETESGPLKIMTFGKFGTYKKVESLIRAVEIVRKEIKQPLEIVIAGTDNPNTPGYLEGIKNSFSEVPMLTFTGYVEEEVVPRIFSESAMVVFPYTSTTGSSGVLHQAGSYGKAVVMPNLGDLSRLVKDEGYRGEFFDPTSDESLAAAIKNLVTDEAYRLEIAKANYAAATSFPMSKIADMYVDEFHAIGIKEINRNKIAA
jgi:glycosyltransferase involved in cell wall biosynthesis